MQKTRNIFASYVGHLRQKIENKADDPRIIVTEPGVGYRVAESE